MAGSACSVLAVLSVILSLLATCGSLVTNRWYVVELPNAEEEYGLWRYCVSGTCNGYNTIFAAAGQITQCARAESGVKTRFNATRALMIVSAIAQFVAMLLIVSAKFTHGPCFAIVGMALALLGGALTAVSVMLWVWTWSWLYCDQTICEYTQQPGCVDAYGYSLILAGMSIGLALIAVVSTGCAYRQMTSPEGEEDEEEAPLEQRRDRSVAQQPGNQSAYATPAKSGGETGTAASPKKEKDLPDGDWTYDPDSGLYWSETEQLYLDRETEQYYDPSAGQWYDPVSDTWYEA